MDRARLEMARKQQNVVAFLRVIREGESSQDERAYRMRWGGLGKPVAYFDDFAAHPRVFEPTTGGRRSSAAGAYQITATTYDDFAPRLGIGDFAPASQDALAVAIIDSEGALDDVMAGRFEAALAKLRGRWTSLPGAAENHRLTPARALAVYERFGGSLTTAPPDASDTQPAAPIEDRSIPYQERPMPLPILALVSAFGPLIAQMIPQVAKLFAKPESAVATRNIEAIQLVFDALTKATQTDTVQAAVEAMATDPAKLAAAQTAVVTEPAIMAVLEIGDGGIAKAREANAAIAALPVPLYRNPAIVIAMLLMPLVYIVVMSVLFASDDSGAANFWRGFWGPGFMPETRSATVNLVLGMVLGGIMGFFFGTTFGSNRKTDLIANQTAEFQPKP